MTKKKKCKWMQDNLFEIVEGKKTPLEVYKEARDYHDRDWQVWAIQHWTLFQSAY